MIFIFLYLLAAAVHAFFVYTRPVCWRSYYWVYFITSLAWPIFMIQVMHERHVAYKNGDHLK